MTAVGGKNPVSDLRKHTDYGQVDQESDPSESGGCFEASGDGTCVASDFRGARDDGLDAFIGVAEVNSRVFAAGGFVLVGNRNDLAVGTLDQPCHKCRANAAIGIIKNDRS